MLATEKSETLLRGLKLATMDFDSIKPAKPVKKAKTSRGFDINNYHFPKGTAFGMWTVTGDSEHKHYPSGLNKAVVPVVCVCGKEALVRHHDIKTGSSTGCRACRMKASAEKRRLITHGALANNLNNSGDS